MRRKIVLIISSILILFLVIECGNKMILKDVYVEVTDINDYDSVLGVTGTYKYHFGKYNDIFPEQIKNENNVEKFCYIYLNTFDPCYMGYLIMNYDEESFQIEKDRLKNIDSSENHYIYGAKGFLLDVLAVYANEYYGYIYALADYEKSQIIYVELQFCNGIMDINYLDKIAQIHLPINFNTHVEYEFMKRENK